MKRAVLVAIPAAHGHGYTWKWRCVESKTESKTTFTLYYDCLTDAQTHGYQVELTHAQGLSAPGGERHNVG